MREDAGARGQDAATGSLSRGGGGPVGSAPFGDGAPLPASGRVSSTAVPCPGALRQVTWAPNKRVDANGTRNSKADTARPLPGRNSGALLGRIGDRDTFFIGLDVGPFRIRTNGRLYLGVNDDNLEDNTGGYRVVVSY